MGEYICLASKKKIGTFQVVLLEQIIYTSPPIFPVSPTSFFYFAHKGCNFAAQIQNDNEECIFYNACDAGERQRKGTEHV